ncbi:MAG: zinc-binding alcohol dehydrogenase family protein [Actinomycetota bacterium]|nr:zinc-binding alcohol dehydrogenase family protein [Actinomycetota bacterium]
MDHRSPDGLAVARAGARVSAAIVDAPGAEPRIGWVEPLSRAAEHTTLAVIAAPLNPLDLLVASGTFHSARHEAAYVPGSECVGVVVESDRFHPGALLYAECHASPTTPGTFATHVTVPDADLLPLPEGVDPVQAAAVGNSGTAAFMPLVEVAGLKPDDAVLVLGATGAVGQLAVQIAHLRGADRVIGVARDREALERLRALGAQDVVELRVDESAEQLALRIQEVAGLVDVVLDGLYGVPFEAALQTCAPRARVVNIGHSAGPNATISAGLLRGRQLTVSGFAGLHTPLRDKRIALEWLWNELSGNRLQVAVATVSLEELPIAWRAQATSPHVNYVVVPTSPKDVSFA